ncbi:MAG: PQQ-dependent sugar dehydrogenase, partial [Halobacteriales archaeon]|nr:PQQ-dependent sugar dehydrogenase [Halobacteriales archaeon]
MPRWLRALALACALAALAPPALGAPTHDGLDWSRARATVLAADVDHPNDVAVAPDGSLWFTLVFEGNVKRLDLGTRAITQVWHAPIWTSADYSERGLAGLAFAADAATSGAYYLYYTHDDASRPDGVNRLVRMDGWNETVLVDGIPAAEHHNGGRIAVAHDGSLFVSTGDNDRKDPAHDLGSPLGKVLHVSPEGKPMPDDVAGLIYSYGHRNVYGLAIEPVTGAVFATENNNAWRDELNLLRAGKDYGYPACEAFAVRDSDAACPSGYERPLLQFYGDHPAAPTGMAFWQGGLYWASFNEASIHH